MPRKNADDLRRKDERGQETESGLKIPVPKRGDFQRFVVGIKRQKREAVSRRDPEKR